MSEQSLIKICHVTKDQAHLFNYRILGIDGELMEHTFGNVMMECYSCDVVNVKKEKKEMLLLMYHYEKAIADKEIAPGKILQVERYQSAPMDTKNLLLVHRCCIKTAEEFANQETQQSGTSDDSADYVPPTKQPRTTMDKTKIITLQPQDKPLMDLATIVVPTKCSVYIRVVSKSDRCQTKSSKKVKYTGYVFLDDTGLICFYLYFDKEYLFQETLECGNIYLIKNLQAVRAKEEFSPYGKCQLQATDFTKIERYDPIPITLPNYQINFVPLSEITEERLHEFVDVLVRVVGEHKDGKKKNGTKTRDFYVVDGSKTKKKLYVWGLPARQLTFDSGTVLAIFHAKVMHPEKAEEIVLGKYVITSIIENYDYKSLDKYSNWFEGQRLSSSDDEE